MQAELGYVSAETARELAEIFEILPIEVMEVVSFYNMFFDHAAAAAPRARVHEPALLAARRARAAARARGAPRRRRAGETRRDGRIHLGHEECLGACAYAPMMRVDDTYHEDLDVAKAKAMLDALA